LFQQNLENKIEKSTKLKVVKVNRLKKLLDAKMNGAKPKKKLEKSASIATEMYPARAERAGDSERPKSARPLGEKQKSEESMDEADNFFELLHKFQSRRIDDQRCSFRVVERSDSQNSDIVGQASYNANSPQAEEFLDMVAGIQGSRMNDQRASLPTFPGLHNSQEIIGQILNNKPDPLDDGFFDMIFRCQGSRIEDQRSEMPTRSAPTVPDEDFFSLIQRVQSNRIDEQRTPMPEKSGSTKRSNSGKEKKKKEKKEKENKK
jgi:G-protein signaling modulator 2